MSHPGKCKGAACNFCRLYRESDFHNRLWGGPGLPGGRTLGRPPRPSPGTQGGGCCGGAYDFAAPVALAEVGPEGLSRKQSGFAFNAGWVRYKGRLLLFHRDGWAGSNVHCAELNEDYTVRRSVVLTHLAHPRAAVGREDPRPFVFRGRLHVAYIGVERVGGRIRTSQLYARLTDDLHVEEVFYPEYEARNAWEKNWSFFEHAGELFCVYSIAPHCVLHVRGNKAYPFAEADYPFPWGGGFLRGGASPVQVGGEFYHWFHGKTADYLYSVGLYTFEASPPFRPVAATPSPLLWADREDNARVDKNYCACVFPQGAIREHGRWKISCGWNDRRIKVAEWDEAAVARVVSRPVAAPAWLRLREGTSDADIFREVCVNDEYGVGGLDLAGGVVMDVGGHIGTFAYMAHLKGAARVYCYEPYAESRERLAAHAVHMPAVEVVPAAVGPGRGRSDGWVGYPPDPANPGGLFVHPRELPGLGRTAVLGFAGELERVVAAHGRVDFLKLDCEGGEWGVFADLTAEPGLAARIGRICGEWHPPGDAARVRSHLEPLGFVVTTRPTEDGRGVFVAARP